MKSQGVLLNRHSQTCRLLIESAAQNDPRVARPESASARGKAVTERCGLREASAEAPSNAGLGLPE